MPAANVVWRRRCELKVAIEEIRLAGKININEGVTPRGARRTRAAWRKP